MDLKHAQLPRQRWHCSRQLVSAELNKLQVPCVADGGWQLAAEPWSCWLACDWVPVDGIPHLYVAMCGQGSNKHRRQHVVRGTLGVTRLF